MASEIHVFGFTIPAGTLQTAPITANLTMPQRTVTQINIKVPPGPRGSMGFQIGAAGVQLIPAIIGAYVVTDNQDIEWPLSNQINSGAWQAFGYNVGIYPHTVYLTFLCEVPGAGVVASTPLVDLSTLSSSPS